MPETRQSLPSARSVGISEFRRRIHRRQVEQLPPVQVAVAVLRRAPVDTRPPGTSRIEEVPSSMQWDQV